MKAKRLCSIILFCLVLIASPLPNFSHTRHSDDLYKRTKAFLKKHPEQINTLDSRGLGVLHRAVRNNNIRIVKLLIKRGADVNLRGILEITPLHFAANEGNVEISKLLVSNGAKINPVMSNGWSPLHVAAKKLHYSQIKFLLLKGADPNLSDKLGNTPFHSALLKYEYHFDFILKRALKKRFEKTQNKKANTHKTSEKLKSYSNVGTPQILKSRSIASNFKGFMGIKKNHLDTLEIIKLSGADINARNNKGFTPLHIACRTEYFNFNYSKDIYVSKWLVDNGADVNARDTKGNTPVFYVGGDVEEFNLLKNHGALISIQNNNGETPLFYLYGKVAEILINSPV